MLLEEPPTPRDSSKDSDLNDPSLRGVETPDKDPDYCGPDGEVFVQEGPSPSEIESASTVRGLKVHLTTFGCQMNKYDSEMVAGLLNIKGVVFVEKEDEAELQVFNTCSVRAHAEERVYSRLGALKHRKRKDPGFLLAVMGCMAQKEGDTISKRFPFVDLIVGTRMLDQFPTLLERVREGAATPMVAIDTAPRVDFGETVARRASKFQALMAVTRGCNKRCTFCVVPYTRGPEISRPIDEIVAEARRLVDDGVIEITLLGQTIDTYGFDLSDSAANLPGLLQRLYRIDGLERIRFITSHPKECREELWATMNELRDKVMPYVHMPAQSGSNRMLRRMARGYTRERYLEVVESARRLRPDIEIASDWIVGFSGETDEEFEETMSLMEAVRPQSSYIFKYSVREGTPAQKLPDDVPVEVKKSRNQRLLALQERISLEKNQERVGHTEHVLVEGTSKTNRERLTGRSETFRLVHFPGDESLIGRILDVRITGATALSLQGEIVKQG